MNSRLHGNSFVWRDALLTLGGSSSLMNYSMELISGSRAVVRSEHMSHIGQWSFAAYIIQLANCSSTTVYLREVGDIMPRHGVRFRYYGLKTEIATRIVLTSGKDQY